MTFPQVSVWNNAGLRFGWSGALLKLATGCFVVAALAHAEPGEPFRPASKGQDDKGPETEFYGIVQKMPAAGLVGDWQVAGKTLHMGASAEVRQDKAAARVGGCAEVKGVALGDGSVEGIRLDMQRSASDCGDSGAFRDDYVETKGVLQSLPASGLIGDWTVAGRTVKVSAGTRVKDESQRAVVGACVEIKGQLGTNGSIAASTVELKPAGSCATGSGSADQVESYGLIRRTPASGLVGDWQIGDWTYRVLSAAVVRQDAGPAALGACVEVKGERQADNTITVKSMEVKSRSGACISPRSVRNAASYDDGRVSPGQLVTVFGFGIGPRTAASYEWSDDKRISTSAGGVRVLFDDTPAPILLGSMNQVNAIVPYSVGGKTSVKIEVEYSGSRSNAVVVPVVTAMPALFTADSSGHGHGVASNQDGSFNSVSTPAARGSVVVVYATGWGAANRRLDDGAIVPDAATLVAAPVSVLIGGREATVLYAGAMPGQVGALAQINFRVPDDCPSGSDVPVLLRIGNESSQPGVTLAVK